MDILQQLHDLARDQGAARRSTTATAPRPRRRARQAQPQDLMAKLRALRARSSSRLLENAEDVLLELRAELRESERASASCARAPRFPASRTEQAVVTQLSARLRYSRNDAFTSGLLQEIQGLRARIDTLAAPTIEDDEDDEVISPAILRAVQKLRR